MSKLFLKGDKSSGNFLLIKLLCN